MFSWDPRYRKPCAGREVHGDRQRAGLGIEGHIPHKPRRFKIPKATSKSFASAITASPHRVLWRYFIHDRYPLEIQQRQFASVWQAHMAKLQGSRLLPEIPHAPRMARL